MTNDENLHVTDDLVAPETTEAAKSDKQSKQRTSFTLEPDLFAWVKETAKARKISVSAVISECLAKYRAANG